MQTKIKETKLHKTGKHFFNIKEVPETEVLVAEGELVLVECKPEEAKFYKYQHNQTNVIHPLPMGYIVKGLVIYLKPIIISKTEKIEEGDTFVYNSKRKTVEAWRYMQNTIEEVFCIKILALPEHFSPQQLQDIVDGKLKEGKVLVECEAMPNEYDNPFTNPEGKNDFPGSEYEIKLNPHITLHKVEEKMYTREEIPFKQIGDVLKYLEDQSVYDKMSRWNDPYYKLKKWFEQNVK